MAESSEARIEDPRWNAVSHRRTTPLPSNALLDAAQTPRDDEMRAWPLGQLARRCRRPELMDQPGLDRAEHARALEGLRRINWLSRSHMILWPSIAGLAQIAPCTLIRVLDVASGGGDVCRALARRANLLHLKVRVDGCDKSPEAVRYAQDRAAAGCLPVQFFTLDALADPIPEGYDVVTCSLFLHHLDDANAVGLLKKMADAAGRLVLVNDLVRGGAGYALAWVGCRLLSRSLIVRHDGPASVAAAFAPGEVRELARRAGLESATLTRHWPRRFLLSWYRTCP
jgi:SAM-dependent methyltransferase